MNIEVSHTPATEIRASARPTNLTSGLEGLTEFAEAANRLEADLKSLAELTGDSTTRAVERLSKALAEFEPTITILGQVKSGKTSLVNAMAGWTDLLPSDVNPWTTVVTSLHLKPGTKPAGTGARFRFMTEAEWDRLSSKGGRIGELASRAGAESELQKICEQIETVRNKARNRLGRKFELLLGEEHEYGYFDKNLLERYICLGDDFEADDAPSDTTDQGKFADITRSADLYLNCLTVPCGICLRDTPGVNDTFMMREQITVQAIRDSRICVVVLSASQALTAVDMGLIRLISNLKSRDVLIFVNRVDELLDPVNQIPEIKESIKKTLRDRKGPENAEIIFGSAFWASNVLSGDIEGIPQANQKALFEWAEAALDPHNSETQPHNILWELSGIPALFKAISDRVVAHQGKPLLQKIARSAVTISTGQEAARAVQIGAVETSASMSMHSAIEEFDRLATHHMEALEKNLEILILEYHQRADKAHATFIERATQSLLSHLEVYGTQTLWSYDPTGLRMLLRSAYSLFGSRAQKLAGNCYEAALIDVAELYSRVFGSAVEGIQISVPVVPDFPAPVSIGQTIALDFNDGWWVSWWQRVRGFEAFARRFQQLIFSETEDFMIQLKSVQTEMIRKQVVSTLTDFLDDQRDILFEIGTRRGNQDKLQELFVDDDASERLNTINDLLERLRSCAE
jgi:signal recognition particle receptor subunit beta